MTTYNVLSAVVELIDADNERDAIRKLEDRLRANGYETYDSYGAPTKVPAAFVSEVQS